MRITVIVPPSIYTETLQLDFTIRAPLEGAALAATILQKKFENIQLTCHDLRVKPRNIEFFLDNHDVDNIFCIAGIPDGYKFIKTFASHLRKYEMQKGICRTPIIIGGQLATISWRTVLSKTEVDFCIFGECELAFPALIQRISNGVPAYDIPVASKDKNGNLVFGDISNDNWIPEMNEIPCPNYRLWEESHGNLLTKTACYSTQRGCPFGCEFCANPYRLRFRMADIKKIEHDLLCLKDQGFESICFNDPTFNLSEERTREIAFLMKRIGLPWIALIRATPVSHRLFSEMKDAGCQTLLLGVESADQKVLDKSVKGIQVKETEACLRYADEVGIPVLGFLIIGLPGESKESLESMKRFVLNHSFFPRAFYACPFPGTGLYRSYMEATQKIDESPEDFEEKVLIWMSGLKHDGTDEPLDLPGRAVTKENLKETMAWVISSRTNRHLKLLQDRIRSI